MFVYETEVVSGIQTSTLLKRYEVIHRIALLIFDYKIDPHEQYENQCFTSSDKETWEHPSVTYKDF